MAHYPDMNRIEEIKFKMLSDEEIEKVAVLKITNESSVNSLGHVLRNGIHDLRMGPASTNWQSVCETCGQNATHCQGHFGCIDLPMSLFNPVLVDVMVSTLNLVCYQCGNLFLKNELQSLQLCYQRKLIQEGYPIQSLDVPQLISHTSVPDEEMETSSREAMSLMDAKTRIQKFYKNLKKNEEASPVFTTMNGIAQDAMKKTLLDFKASASACRTCQKNRLKFRMQGTTLQIVNADSVTIEDNEILYEGQQFITADQARQLFRKAWENNRTVLIAIYPFLDRKDMEYPTDLFFMRKLLVSPPRFRPYMQRDDKIVEAMRNGVYLDLLKSSKCISVLTSLKRAVAVSQAPDEDLARIVRRMQPVNGTYEEKINVIMKEMQETIFNLFSASSKSQTVGKKGVKQVLEKKQGLVRQCLMGKRVNFSARSVAAPDPNLCVDEVGVPERFALILSYPVPVTSWNVGYLRKLVINGAHTYPGAVKIVNEDGLAIHLGVLNEKQRIGHANRLLTTDNLSGNKHAKPKIVWRHMQSGDFVLMNRQPTLHRPSIQAHKVRVMPNEKVLRMPYANCKAYNADFDGDELNLHFPQSEVARSECKYIVTTHNNYLTTKDGTPLAGLIQDSVVAGVKLTVRGRFFNRSDYMQLVYLGLSDIKCKVKLLPPAILKPYKLWSGKQVISTILHNIIPEGKERPNFRFKTQVKVDLWQNMPSKQNAQGPSAMGGRKESMTESELVVRSGELLCGVIDKCSIGPVRHGMIHVFYELYGPTVASMALTCMSRVTLGYLKYVAHSISSHEFITPCNMTKNKNDRLWNLVNNCGKEVAEKLDMTENELRSHMERIRACDNKKAIEIVDRTYSSVLGTPTSQIIKDNEMELYRSTLNNNMRMMVETGAKGSKINMNQMASLFGSVALDGKRIPVTISGKTLPYFERNDTSPLAGGYIPNRFMTGMNHQSAFYLGIVGRDSLQHTAVKTASSGYMQRCLIKHLEGISVHYDGTVRNSDGLILQYQYGEDGQDVGKMPFITANESMDVLVDNFSEVMDKRSKDTVFSLHENQDQVHKYKKKLMRNKKKCVSFRERHSGFLNFCAAQSDSIEGEGLGFHYGRSSKSLQLIAMWRNLSPEKKSIYTKSVPPARLDPTLSKFSALTNINVVTEHLDDMIDEYYDDVYSKRALSDVTKSRKEIRQTLYAKNVLAKVDGGEAVGALCAQAIGEPLTQMTLNTFHFAGRDELNVTLGVPRMIEILRLASSKIKTPIMEIPFLPTISQKAAETIGKKLGAVTLSQLTIDVTVTVELAADSRRQLYNKVTLSFKFLAEKYAKKFYMVSHSELQNYFENTFVLQFMKSVDKAFAAKNVNGEMNFTTTRISEKMSEENPEMEEENEECDQPQEAQSDTENPQADDECEYSSGEESESDGHEEPPNGVIKMEPQDYELGSDSDDHENSQELKSESSLARETYVKNLHPRIQNYCFPEKKFKCCDLTLALPLVDGLHDVASILRSRVGKAQLRPYKFKKVCVVEKDDHFLLRTEGVDFEAVRLFEGQLDINRLYTNNISLFCEMYGVEAAQRSIIKEIRSVQSAYDIKVDFRHLSLLADYFTCEGMYKACSRSAMGTCPSFMQSMTFETLTKVIKTSLLEGQKDSNRSPSANILVGSVIGMGTNSMGIHSIPGNSAKDSNSSKSI